MSELKEKQAQNIKKRKHRKETVFSAKKIGKEKFALPENQSY